jgi:soluble lytic murein transglycosylase-like protein
MKYCEEAGERYGICPELLEAIIEEESNGDPDAIGDAGEIGLMQIYPKFHSDRLQRMKDEGLSTDANLFAPRTNILIGADYLGELFAEYEDVGTVLMVYNGTEDAEWLGQQGRYTDYAKRILKRSRQLERLHGK